MQKDEAIVKVRKIVTQANGTSNKYEKDAALNQARRLMVKYGITAEEVDSLGYLAAYDEISKLIIDFTNANPIVNTGVFGSFNVLGEQLDKTKEHLSSSHKALLVKKLRSDKNRQFLLFLMGNQFNPLMTQIEVILRNHNINER